MLEAQRRRRVGGLDEDGPEDLHVLAGARLDVLVQDVDAPLCSSSSSPHSRWRTYQNMDGWIYCNVIGEQQQSTKALDTGNRERDDWRHVLLFWSECMRTQSFLSGDKSDRIHAMAAAGRSLSSLPRL